MRQTITININVLTLDRLFGGDLGVYAEKARAIEDAGIDGIVMPDHVVFGGDAVYPFGNWSVDPSDSWPEPMTVLALMAGATRRVSLITNVLIAPLRSAVLLAKQAATLHGLSNKRFQLGVGTGWQKQEYEASGVAFAGRGAHLFDQIGACRALWRNRPAQFASKHVRFDDVWCVPGIPGDDDLPLWFGLAPSESNARFFAEFGGGWSSIFPDPDFIAAGRATLQKALSERFGLSGPLPVRAAPAIETDATGAPCIERTIANIHRSVAAGVTAFDIPMMFFVHHADQFEPFIQALGRIPRSYDI